MDENDKTGAPADWHRYFQPLVLVLLSGLLALSIPLESKRPSVDKAVASMPGIQLNARLWMDPLEVPQRDQEHKHITRFDDLGGQIFFHLEKISSENRKVRFIAVMVDGGPYFESIERRRRTRYAIISSLIAEGYHAEDRDHIRYFGHLPEPWRYYDPQQETRVMSTAERQMPEIIPYEWFESNKENTPSIALLWINESQISTRPLSKLWVIKNELQLAGLRAINLQSQAVSPEALVKSDQQKKADKGRSNRRNDSPPNKIKLREMTLENTCPEGTSQLIKADEWKAVYSAEEILKNAYHNTAGLNEVVTELKNLSSHGSRNYKSHGPGFHNASIPYTLSENSFLFQQLGPRRSAELLDCFADQIEEIFTEHPITLSSNTFDFTVLGPTSSDGFVAMLQDPEITSPVQSE
ncbi:MAG: hypothetical protein RLZZ09_303, partial [Pseudomonadota bacterium]